MSAAFDEAFMIMVTGMGTVFVFLLLLLAAMHLLRYLTASKDTAQQPTTAAVTAPPAAHIAAISAAVQRYRRNHNQ